MEGVRAEKGPPGVGTNPSEASNCGEAAMLIPSPTATVFSSSSSESVSAVKHVY